MRVQLSMVIVYSWGPRKLLENGFKINITLTKLYSHRRVNTGVGGGVRPDSFWTTGKVAK